MIDVPFFNIINRLANARHMDVCFYEDEYEGWFARFSFSDMNGRYSAEVPYVDYAKPRNVLVGKYAADYEARIRRLCDKAISQAHSRRNVRAAA